MTKTPVFPSGIEKLIDEYYSNEGGPLTYRREPFIPDFPKDLLKIIGEYQAPTTVGDLIVLHTFDPSGKVLPKIFNTEPQYVQEIIDIIGLPESTMEEVIDKLNLSIEVNYYPLTHRLYQKLRDNFEDDPLRLSKSYKVGGAFESVFYHSLEAKDYDTAREIASILGGRIPDVEDLILNAISRGDQEETYFLLNYTTGNENYERIVSRIIQKGWFDFFVHRFARPWDWDYWLGYLTIYPELEKIFIEKIAPRFDKSRDPKEIEKDVEKILNVLSESDREESNVRRVLKILRDFGVSDDYINQWTKRNST